MGGLKNSQVVGSGLGPGPHIMADGGQASTGPMGGDQHSNSGKNPVEAFFQASEWSRFDVIVLVSLVQLLITLMSVAGRIEA